MVAVQGLGDRERPGDRRLEVRQFERRALGGQVDLTQMHSRALRVGPLVIDDAGLAERYRPALLAHLGFDPKAPHRNWPGDLNRHAGQCLVRDQSLQSSNHQSGRRSGMTGVQVPRAPRVAGPVKPHTVVGCEVRLGHRRTIRDARDSGGAGVFRPVVFGVSTRHVFPHLGPTPLPKPGEIICDLDGTVGG